MFSEVTQKIEIMGAQGLVVTTTQWDPWIQELLPSVLFMFPSKTGVPAAEAEQDVCLPQPLHF